MHKVSQIFRFLKRRIRRAVNGYVDLVSDQNVGGGDQGQAALGTDETPGAVQQALAKRAQRFKTPQVASL